MNENNACCHDQESEGVQQKQGILWRWNGWSQLEESVFQQSAVCTAKNVGGGIVCGDSGMSHRRTRCEYSLLSCYMHVDDRCMLLEVQALLSFQLPSREWRKEGGRVKERRREMDSRHWREEANRLHGGQREDGGEEEECLERKVLG